MTDRELYQDARRVLDHRPGQPIASLADRLRAHHMICTLNSRGGAGSMAIAENQSAALADISLALAALLDRTER
jgi:hypothetical protein